MPATAALYVEPNHAPQIFPRSQPQHTREINHPVVAALRTARWFDNWPQSALVACSRGASISSYRAGEVLAKQGEPQGQILVVVRGRVRAIRQDESGREVSLETFRLGHVCLDALFEPGKPMPNDWKTAETCLIVHISREAFLSQVLAIPEAAVAVARDFERRMDRLKNMAAGLVLSDVETRLRHLVCQLAEDEGEAASEGVLIRKCPTQQEIGTNIGACRETVSRLIAEYARQGLLRLRGRQLFVTEKFLQS